MSKSCFLSWDNVDENNLEFLLGEFTEFIDSSDNDYEKIDADCPSLNKIARHEQNKTTDTRLGYIRPVYASRQMLTLVLAYTLYCEIQSSKCLVTELHCHVLARTEISIPKVNKVQQYDLLI